MVKKKRFPHLVTATTKLYADQEYIMVTVHDDTTAETFQFCWYWRASLASSKQEAVKQESSTNNEEDDNSSEENDDAE